MLVGAPAVTPGPAGEVWTIVVAAGAARRFGADKLRSPLHGDRTVLDLTLETATTCSDGVVLVVRPDDPLLDAPPAGAVVVAGGATRSGSVRCGLAAVPDGAAVILVHDAARPLASPAVYERVVAAVRAGAPAAVPVVGLVDTIRSVDGGCVERDRLRAVQTPQGFRAEALREAHRSEGDATDDATVVERRGHEVTLVDGDPGNLKITRPVDVVVAQALLGAGDDG